MRVPLPAVLVLAGVLFAGCGDDEIAPPNLVLVTLDTTRADRLSCYGYHRPTTPNLDALAERGTRFENVWSQSPETGPSLASVLTSRRPPVTGVRANAQRLGPSLATLATLARADGRETAAFVSTVLLRHDVCGFDRGFDTYDDEMTDPCFGHPNAQRIASRTIDRALEWLEGRRGSFFLWVHLYDPHGPYTPPESTPGLDGSSPHVPGSGLRPEQIPKYQRVDGSTGARDYADRYDREIRSTDRHLGRLLDALDMERTVVAVHADHGEALGEDDYWFRHGNLLHDAALRVPWILAGPGVPRGRVVPYDVRNLDIAPTVAGLVMLPPLPDAEGFDLGEAVSGAAPVPPLEFVAEARKDEIVRDDTGIDTRWKLRYRTSSVDVTWWPGSPDLEVRVSGDPAHADLALRALRTWLQEPVRVPSALPRGTPISEETDRALRSLGYR